MPCALLTAAFCGTLAAAPSAKKAAASADRAGVFGDDLAKLAEAVNLTEEQQKKMEALKAARESALAKWDQANQKKVTGIQQAIGKLKGKGSERKRAGLERQLKGLQDGRARLAATHERALYGALTREQRGKWNGPILAAPILKEFERLGLDDTQKQKINELCRVRGEGVSASADPKLHEVTFKAVKQQPVTAVLTADQRKQLQGTNRKAAPSAAKARPASIPKSGRGA